MLSRVGQQAQLYVPRLLDVLAGGGAPEAAFASGWRSVPLAAFLPWAPSMLSLLDEPHGEALLPALEVSLRVADLGRQRCNGS